MGSIIEYDVLSKETSFPNWSKCCNISLCVLNDLCILFFALWFKRCFILFFFVRLCFALSFNDLFGGAVGVV